MDLTPATYLLIDLCSLALPLVASFHPKLQFWKQWPALAAALLIAGTLLVGWDIIFTRMGVWGFNSQYLLGPRLFNLPQEEVLFFFCIPYACLFSYYSLCRLHNNFGYGKKTTRVLVSVICAVCAVTVACYSHRYYTAVTLSLVCIFLGYQTFVQPKQWMGAFLATYTIMLIPFFVVNGLLTGTGLAAPVVWYNAAHITGLRIATIPVEDIGFGILMLGLQTSLFEWFREQLPLKGACPSV